MELQRLRLGTHEPIDVLVGVFATFGPDGHIVRMDLTLEDIGDRKRAEKELRASEARFRAVFETSNVGMAITDLAGHIQRANAAMCRFLGRTETELLGVDSLSLVHPDDRPPRPEPGEEHDLGAARREIRFVRRDGEVAWGYVTFSWLADGPGAPHSVFAVVQDISERKRVEQDLLRLAKVESLGVLAGGIAHDFNNILALILGNITFAAQLPDSGPRTRELLHQAELGCIRASELARRFLTFAKGGLPNKRLGSIAELVRETVALHARDARVELDLPADLWPVELDAGQMSQVMHNLVLNATQAMPNGGVARVVGANVEIDSPNQMPLAPGRYVCVRVIDEGVGIARDDLDRIFDPYFSTKKTGSGLGLTTAHSIVRKHDGHISVTSTLGRGTTFEVYLPASVSQEVAQPTSRVESSVDIAQARVLVMDDDATIRAIVAAVLRERVVVVDVVAKGEEAIAAFDAGHRYDVVLLDLTIRDGLGGAATLSRLRAIDPKVKAIMMSGYSADFADASAQEMGFAAVLPKPCSASDLEATVRRVIASS